jgi:hypothetical protein
MHSSVLTIRLQQLDSNVSQILVLLNEYEVELIDEDDPGRKRKYRRRIEELERQKNRYEQELTVLQGQVSSGMLPAVQIIANQLEMLDSKLNFILKTQVSIQQVVLSQFQPVEQNLLNQFTERLADEQLVEVQAVLEAIENNKVSGHEMKHLLLLVQSTLTEVKSSKMSLPVSQDKLLEVLNLPSLDTKHALKFSLPIIPFILSYEGEVGLGGGLKLREAWQALKGRFKR